MKTLTSQIIYCNDDGCIYCDDSGTCRLPSIVLSVDHECLNFEADEDAIEAEEHFQNTKDGYGR